MNKTTGVVIGVIVAMFAGLIACTTLLKSNNEKNYEQYDQNSVISANDNNGGIADHVKGNAKAPVLIFEYADYQCPGCATLNPRLSELIKKYDGKLGIVYRSFLLSYHQNGNAAAAAAEAAGLQGHWQPYASLLFANQAEWGEASAKKRGDIFVKYFQKVAGEKADVAKFQADMAGTRVQQKIKFDGKMGARANVEGTPALYLDGKLIDWSKAKTKDEFSRLMIQEINQKLKSLDITPPSLDS